MHLAGMPASFLAAAESSKALSPMGAIAALPRAMEREWGIAASPYPLRASYSRE